MSDAVQSFPGKGMPTPTNSNIIQSEDYMLQSQAFQYTIDRAANSVKNLAANSADKTSVLSYLTDAVNDQRTMDTEVWAFINPAASQTFPTYAITDKISRGPYLSSSVDAVKTEMLASLTPGLQNIVDIYEALSTDEEASKTFAFTLAQLPVKTSSVSITDGTETFTDNGAGVLTSGAGGTGTINYTTGVTSITFNTAPAPEIQVNASYKKVITAESIGTGDGLQDTFPFTLTGHPVSAGSVTVTDGTETFTDNGLGVLTGSAGGTGTITYTTGVGSVTFNAAPANLAAITSSYNKTVSNEVVGTGNITLTAPFIISEDNTTINQRYTPSGTFTSALEDMIEKLDAAIALIPGLAV